MFCCLEEFMACIHRVLLVRDLLPSLVAAACLIQTTGTLPRPAYSFGHHNVPMAASVQAISATCDYCHQHPAVWGVVAPQTRCQGGEKVQASIGEAPGSNDQEGGNSGDPREWYAVVCKICLAERREIDLRGLLKLSQRCLRCSRFASFGPEPSRRAIHCRRHSTAGEVDVAHKHLRCFAPVRV